MRRHLSLAGRSEFERVRELTARIGNDPLLSQASTGNTSIKIGDELWIKASGRWMAAALRDDIFVRLSLPALKRRLREGLDPAAEFREASIETAMHVAIPQAVVVHVHSIDAIAWTVRADGLFRLREQLNGMRWQWLPYLASGLPLARGITDALRARPDTELFALANHGLIIAANNAEAAESLLKEVQRRLNIPRRFAPPADYSALSAIRAQSLWDLPENDGIHALGTDPLSRRIVSQGILYPCQAIFSGGRGLDCFRPISRARLESGALERFDRQFLILENCGVLVSRNISPAGQAMLAGLAEVVQRMSALVPIRYLQAAEIAALSPDAMHRYCELANESCLDGWKADSSNLHLNGKGA